MTISLQLAELMGGGLDCESVPGQGSLFTLTLPMPAVEETGTAEGVDPGVPRQVLVVDDIELNRRIAAHMAGKAGADVTEASGGPQAVALASNNDYDLILMDIQMPEMDGFEASRLILDQVPGARIVVLSAEASPEIPADLSNRIDGVLVKPLSEESLAGLWGGS